MLTLRKPTLTQALNALALGLAALLLASCASREERIQKIQAQANAALFDSDSETAINALSKGLDRYPDSNELRIALSRALQNAGQLSEAADVLEQAIEFDPDQDQLWVKVGEIRSQLGQSEEAIQALQAYLKNNGNDFLAWKTLALENEKLGRVTDAIKAASRWNDITPSSQPALKLGQLYLASRNIPQARSWFGQAAAYKDNYAAKDALAELIQLETSLRQFQQAQSWLTEYRARYGENQNDPRIQESITVLDNWERARREIAEAAAALERERDELESERLNAERAAAEQQANELESALAANESATVSDEDESPTDEDSSDAASGEIEIAPLALLGDDSEASGAAASGDDTTDSSEASGSATDLTAYEEAMLAFDSNDYESAIAQFWPLLGENPDDPQIWYRLSQAYFAQENWFDAEATILEAKRRAPRSEVIANHYLKTILHTQNTNRVLEEIKALRMLFPDSPSIALTLAQTLRNVSAPRSIVSAAYRDFLAIAQRGDPGYQEANQYLQTGN